VTLARYQLDLAYAETRLSRNRELAARGVIPQQMLDDTRAEVDTARAAVEAGQAELAMREATLARAEAVLTRVPADPGAPQGNGSCCVEIHAPQTGTVLWIEDESARPVQPGEALLGIGDLADLEIEVDLLSADAVRLAPGAAATIERWGGPDPLQARLRRIDPRGFTRVSALGIEEQRVRVYLDLVSPPEARAGLGDAFRVFARIVEWEAEEALQLPIGALIRADGDWAVFRVEDGVARLRRVEIGRRSQTMAQVLEGLAPGDRIVAFPGDRIADGTRVIAREGG
jgi:HlyD family secretion protein